MVLHAAFLRWLFIFCTILASTTSCFRMLSEIICHDCSYISLGIIASFVLTSIWCGIKTYSLGLCNVFNYNFRGDVSDVRNTEKTCLFFASQFVTWGLISTTLGVISVLKNNESNLAYQISTTLYSLILGLVCNFLLKIQVENLKYSRK